jgi:bacterioferritin-associated ferredoxin
VIVCHCRAVNHHTVLDTIENGARCADEVAARCGAGSVCGGCRPAVESFLADGDAVATALRLPARDRRAPRGVSRPAAVAP